MKTPPLLPRTRALVAVAILAASMPTQTHSAALSDGLAGYWPLNEGTGTQVIDVSGKQPPGQILQRPGPMEPPEEGIIPRGLGTDGSVWVTDPVRGTVVGFTGTDTDGYILLGEELVPVTDNTDGYTWSFWARSDQGANNDIILGNRFSINNDDTWSSGPRQWIKFTGNQFEYRPNDVARNLDYGNIGVQSQWQHHLVVRDGATLRYYRDGVLTLSRSDLGTVPVLVPLPVYIGGQGRENWRGWVDEVMLYNRALSPLEISLIYQLTKGGVSLLEAQSGAASFFASTPAAGATGVDFDTTVEIAILEGTTKLSDSSVQMTVDGEAVQPAISRLTINTNISVAFLKAPGPAFPETFTPGEEVAASLTFMDSANASTTTNFSFTIVNFVQVPASWKVPITAGQRGMLVRTHQLNNRRFILGDRGARLNPAEEQLAGRIGPSIIDPATFGANGYLVEDATINYSQDSSAQGLFTDATGQTDEGIPGVPATVDGTGENTTGNDHTAVEILAYVELPAGIVTMGVNSDDGFRLTISPIGVPADKLAREVGQFDGGRGALSTEMRMIVEEAGIYAMRLMWFEGQGGFSGEWYSVAADGRRILINDPAEPAALKAYTGPAPTPSAPYVNVLDPFPFGNLTPDTTFPDDSIYIEIVDDPARMVDVNGVTLTVNGQPIGSKRRDGNKVIVEAAPPAGVWPGDVPVALSYSSGGTTFNHEWTMRVLDYVTLEDCLRTPVGSGSDPGMKWLTHWIRTGTRANTVAAAEEQLNLPNDADPSGTADNLFDIANVNFDQVGAVQGLFGDSRIAPRNDAELVVPGIPVDAPVDPNYIVGVATTFIEFPTSGVYYMGVNRDDGFQLTVASAEGGRDIVAGPDVQQIGIFSGGGGTDANNVQFNGFMAVHVPEAGVWPFRLIWYEGTGGGNVEWFQTDKQIPIGLINDNLTTTTLRAFRTRTAQPPANCGPAVPTLTATRSAQGLVMEFTGTLQEATAVDGTFADITATSPHTVPTTQTMRFYRAKQ